MASGIEQTYLEIKLRSLEEVQELLHTTADDAINKVLTAGKLWLTGDRDEALRLSFTEISQQLEAATSSVFLICQELSDGLKKKSQEEMSVTSSTSKKSGKSSKPSGDAASLVSRMDQIEKRLNIKVKSLERSLEDVTSKCSEIEERLLSSFDAITGRMDGMTEHMQRVVSEYSIRVDNIETQLKALENGHNAMKKQLVGVPEDLNRIQIDVLKMKENIQDLNDNEKDSALLLEKVKEETEQDMSRVKLRVAEQMCKYTRPAVGFTAHIPSSCYSVFGQTVCAYKGVIGNAEHSFCKDTGIFTAPVKGLYAVCIKLWQVCKAKQIKIEVMETRKCGTTAGAQHQEMISCVLTQQIDTHDIDLKTRELDVGDTLHVKCFSWTENTSLDNRTSFSCFLIA